MDALRKSFKSQGTYKSSPSWHSSEHEERPILAPDDADDRREFVVKINGNSNGGSSDPINKINNSTIWREGHLDDGEGRQFSFPKQIQGQAQAKTPKPMLKISEDPPSRLISNFLSKQRASGAEMSLDVDLEMEELKKSDPDSRELRFSFVHENSSDSSDDDNDARSLVHRRGRLPVSPQKEGGAGAGAGEVIRCTSNSSFRRPSGLLPTKMTKSRLIDPPVVSPPAAGSSPPNQHDDDKKSGVLPRKSGVVGKVAEEEDDPFPEDDVPDDFKKDKLGKLAILEYVGLILILIALACSLSIRKLQHQTAWELLLWKWEVMLLALICGRLFSNLIIRILVYFIERSFLLRKRVLYFVYGVRSSVQKCLWLGIVLLTWHCMFDRKVARETRSTILLKVTKVLVCLLLTTAFWLVKTVLVKVLASSFHVSTYFDMIQESLFNQYVIETLSCPPLVEIPNIKEEEKDRVLAELRNLQNAGAKVPNDLKAAALGTRSGRLIGRSGQYGARNSVQSAVGKSMRLSGAVSRRESGCQDPIHIDQLHKLNQKNVSAWNMKRLMKIVRHGTLSTLDEQLAHEHGGDDSAMEIKSEFEAKISARKIFDNVARPGSKHIYLADLMRFLREDEARKTLSLFGADQNGRVSRRCLKNWVVNAFRERRALALTLDDTKTAVNKLHQLANVIVAILVLALWLLSLDIASMHFFVFIGSQFLVAVFMFGNTLKMVFEAIIFLFAMHPFDVGDRCEIDGVQLIVEEMNIMTTVFLRYDNQKITYPNSVLATLPIGNFYRSPDMGDAIDFCIHVSTPLEKIAILKERLIGYIDNKKEHWHPGTSVVLRDVDDMNRLKISIWMRHRINFQDMGARWDRRELVVREMINFLKELDVEYRMLPVDVNVRNMPDITSTCMPSNWQSCSQ